MMRNLDKESSASKKFWEDIIIFLVIIGLTLFIITKFLPTNKAKPVVSMSQVKTETSTKITEVNTTTIETKPVAYIPSTTTEVAKPTQLSNNALSNEFNHDLIKCFSLLNQAVTMSKALNGKNANTCTGCDSNKQALVDFFIQRFNVYDSSSPYYKQMRDGLAGDRLLNNPHFLTKDGKLYIIEKAQGRCGDIDTIDPNQANCVIIVDVNGQQGPNQLSTGTNRNQDYRVNDRLRLIVLKELVRPAINQDNDVADYILNFH